MIVRLLSRYAATPLRRRLAHLTEERRRLVGLLRQARAEATTNYALAQQWRSIALRTQDALDASERARTQETHQ